MAEGRSIVGDGEQAVILGVVFDFTSGRPTRDGRTLLSIIPHEIEFHAKTLNMSGFGTCRSHLRVAGAVPGTKGAPAIGAQLLV